MDQLPGEAASRAADTQSRKRASMSERLDVVASAAMIVAAVVMTWKAFDAPAARIAPESLKVPDMPLSLDGAELMGAMDAPVVVIEFSDFECSFCRTFSEEVLPVLRKEYVDGGRAAIAFKQFPLAIHRSAAKMAEAAVCAGRQGRFWEMHDSLFLSDASSGGESRWIASAKAGSLDVGLLETCLEGGDAAKVVAADREYGQRLGVGSTPTFFVGRRIEGGSVKVHSVVEGAQPVERFREAIEQALSGKAR
jgi:protein-disulfide isomerase